MFIALAKIWKPPKFLGMDKEHVTYMSVCMYIYIYMMEYYSPMRKKEILPFLATWVDSEGIMPSEISQTGKDKYCVIILICELLKKPIHRNRIEWWLSGPEEWKKFRDADVGQRVQTSSYKMKKFWESNVQQDDYLTVLYFIYIIYSNLKVAKRVNIVCSCHTKMLIF